MFLIVSIITALAGEIKYTRIRKLREDEIRKFLSTIQFKLIIRVFPRILSKTNFMLFLSVSA
jgi:hypothetical protein